VSTAILDRLLSAPGTLAQVPVDRVRKNPEKPRIFFRQEELEELQDSIRQFGVQVPIAVYKKGNEFVLIDGERRWRCASKLNQKTIPALVQREPGPLRNLLLMFNIHALREQWDTLTIALKLSSI
jgi:ParB/RepB/Spo0J family partition protein